ncbi:MAG: M16 family metallopeptidase [Polyangiales bacterium]
MSARSHETMRTITAAAIGAQLLAHTPGAGASQPGGSPSAAVSKPTLVTLDPAKVGRARLIVEESHDLPLVDVALTFRTGAALDPAEKLGRTRVFGRMLRRGAEGWTNDAIEERLDALGAELGVEVGVSSLTVHLQVIKRNLAPALELMRAIVSKPTFPEAELDKLRREIVAELIELRDNDKALASRAFRRGLFGAHPYGRPNAGTIASIPTLTRDDIRAAYDLHIKRDGVIASVSGDLTLDEVHALVVPLIESVPAGPAPIDATPEPTVGKGRRLIFVDKPTRTQTQILIGGSGTFARDADHVALNVANTIFGGTFTARLMKEIRSERGWSYGASSRLPIERRREAFSMWTFPAATDAAVCLTLELELLEKLLKDGVSDAEVAFAKGYLGQSWAFEIDTASKRVRQVVDEDVLDLPADYHSGYVEHIAAVTTAQANAALRARLSSDDLLIVVVGTAGTLKDEIVKAIPRLASVEVVPFDRD